MVFHLFSISVSKGRSFQEVFRVVLSTVLVIIFSLVKTFHFLNQLWIKTEKNISAICVIESMTVLFTFGLRWAFSSPVSENKINSREENTEHVIWDKELVAQHSLVPLSPSN